MKNLLTTVEAVIEVPQLDNLPPWRIANLPAFSWLRLWRGTTEDETGLVICQLAKYNFVESEEDEHGEGILKQLIGTESLILPGGLRFQNEEGKSITPGCCCGLEGWREWNQLILQGKSPWLGHDPWSWAERRDRTIRVWRDQNSDVYLDMELDEFIGKFRIVQTDLSDFLGNLEKWVNAIAPQLTRPFTEKFDACISIRREL